MRRLILSIIIILLLFAGFPASVNAALTGTWVPSVRSVIGTRAGQISDTDGGPAVWSKDNGEEVKIIPASIYPQTIHLDGLGRITVLVHIPEDYEDPAAKDILDQSFIVNIDESMLDDVSPGDTYLVISFSISNPETKGEVVLFVYDSVSIMD